MISSLLCLIAVFCNVHPNNNTFDYYATQVHMRCKCADRQKLSESEADHNGIVVFVGLADIVTTIQLENCLNSHEIPYLHLFSISSQFLVGNTDSSRASRILKEFAKKDGWQIRILEGGRYWHNVRKPKWRTVRINSRPDQVSEAVLSTLPESVTTVLRHHEVLDTSSKLGGIKTIRYLYRSYVDIDHLEKRATEFEVDFPEQKGQSGMYTLGFQILQNGVIIPK